MLTPYKDVKGRYLKIGDYVIDGSKYYPCKRFITINKENKLIMQCDRHKDTLLRDCLSRRVSPVEDAFRHYDIYRLYWIEKII